MVPAEDDLADQPLGLLEPRVAPAGVLAVVEDVVFPPRMPRAHFPPTKEDRIPTARHDS